MENKNGQQKDGKQLREISYGKQRNGKQRWKTNPNTYLQVKS